MYFGTGTSVTCAVLAGFGANAQGNPQRLRTVFYKMRYNEGQKAVVLALA